MQLPAFDQLPAEKGSYILSFQLPDPVTLRIGQLGECSFLPGLYHYCGSARGSGGIRARLHHHLTPPAHPHWHLDYLHPFIHYQTGIIVSSAEPLECEFAGILLRLPGAVVPVRGFGASDCRSSCAAHLIRLPLSAQEICTHLQNSLKNGIRYNWVILNDFEVK